jgi:hypothetical protein
VTQPDPWVATLDALERAVAAAAAAAHAHGTPPPPVELPHNLGPLPAEHAQRVQALLTEIEAQQAVVANELAAVHAEITRVQRSTGQNPPPSVAGPGGSRFETHA